MEQKKINLEEILKDNCVNIGFLKTMVTPDGIAGSQGQRIINAMKDLSIQLLELTAENAEGDIVDDTNFSEGKIVINKKSITDTLNQVE